MNQVMLAISAKTSMQNANRLFSQYLQTSGMEVEEKGLQGEDVVVQKTVEKLETYLESLPG